MGRWTNDISDVEQTEKSSDSLDEDLPSTQKPKKIKKRKDVIFKAILRECRRYFQVQVNHLTGFTSSKRSKNHEYLYSCLKKFNQERLKKEGTFEEVFYLACLLYPQDLKNNLDDFIKENQFDDYEEAKIEYATIADRIHDTLYKYSFDKLSYFTSKTNIAFLFCYFYENGAGADRENIKYAEEFEIIRQKCMDTLNK